MKKKTKTPKIKYQEKVTIEIHVYVHNQPDYTVTTTTGDFYDKPSVVFN